MGRADGQIQDGVPVSVARDLAASTSVLDPPQAVHPLVGKSTAESGPQHRVARRCREDLAHRSRRARLGESRTDPLEMGCQVRAQGVRWRVISDHHPRLLHEYE